MRLWHKDLIPYLPRQQLLGQWRECCAIARNITEDGTPNHVLVNKVMEYPPDHFWQYCANVCEEMGRRHYQCRWDALESAMRDVWHYPKVKQEDLYSGWHEWRYLKQCLYNLQEKADCGAVPAFEWEMITDRWPWIK